MDQDNSSTDFNNDSQQIDSNNQISSNLEEISSNAIESNLECKSSDLNEQESNLECKSSEEESNLEISNLESKSNNDSLKKDDNLNNKVQLDKLNISSNSLINQNKQLTSKNNNLNNDLEDRLKQCDNNLINNKNNLNILPIKHTSTELSESIDVVDSRTSDEFERKKSKLQNKQTQFNLDELSNKLTNLMIDESIEARENLPDLISSSQIDNRNEQQFNNDNQQQDIQKEESPVYSIKWIKFRNKQCAIVTQNENGCCPLLAIMNVLLLRGKINLPLSTKLITYDQMIVFLANLILENGTSNAPEQFQADYEQNINDAMQLFPKLQTGLDVNVQFNSITSFEYTSEMIIFDLLNISLYHGWCYDPNDLEIVSVIGNFSYNQLVDKIITNKSSNKSEDVSQALIAESFLENTASQLTYYGLSELASNVREQEIGILFRNNHFITLYKNQDQLYQLVTDQGFLQEPDVVWMTLSHIDNDDIFVNHEFKPISPKSNTLSPNEQKKQIDQDYLIALSMEEEEKKALVNQAAIEYDESITINDEELARKLQEEEDRKEKQEAIKNRFNKYNNDENREFNRYYNERDFSPEDEEPLGYKSIDYRRQQQQHQQQQQQVNLNANQQFDDFLNNSNNRHNQQHYQQQEQQLQNSQLDFQQPEFEHENTYRNESLRNNKRSNSSENHTQSSSSRDRNHHHHSQNHGHHSKSSKCIIS